MILTPAKAGLLNGATGTAVAAPIVSMFVRSGKVRRCARLRRRARTGTGRVEREFMPDHALGMAPEGEGQGGLRRVDRGAGMEHTADRTAAIMGLMGAGLVALGR